MWNSQPAYDGRLDGRKDQPMLPLSGSLLRVTSTASCMSTIIRLPADNPHISIKTYGRVSGSVLGWERQELRQPRMSFLFAAVDMSLAVRT